VAVLLVPMLAMVERAWSPRPLLVFGLLSAAGFPVAHRAPHKPAEREAGDGCRRFAPPATAAAFGTIGLGHWATATGLALAGVVALARAKLPAPALLVPVLLAGLLVALGTGFAPAAFGAAHKPIPNENVRGQVELVRAERRFGDVVVVSGGAAYAFGYYWPSPPTFVNRPSFGTLTFQVAYPDLPDVVVARDRDLASRMEALSRIPKGARRVWIIVGHEPLPTWERLASGLGRVVTPVGHPCQAFPSEVRIAANVSGGQCPPLVELRRGEPEPG
jgi:hypothetical protein